jgi:hypothetical protein
MEGIQMWKRVLRSAEGLRSKVKSAERHNMDEWNLEVATLGYKHLGSTLAERREEGPGGRLDVSKDSHDSIRGYKQGGSVGRSEFGS